MAGHRRRRAFGGKAKTVELNGKGSPEMEEAKKTSDDGFKKGGHVKRKAGGKIEGEKERERMDKRARGGKLSHGKIVHHGPSLKKYAKGGSPLSAGHHLSAPNKGSDAGHEGQMPKEQP